MNELLSELLFTDCPCGGSGKCGKCRVRVSGELSAPTDAERRLLGDLLDDGWRLACQTRALGDFKVKEPFETHNVGEPVRKGRGELLIDIGTTTLEVRLINGSGEVLESSALNPQRRFGADVISRIGAASEHSSELTGELRAALASLIGDFEYERAVVTGNTVMLHFLAGLDVSGMAADPFTPSSLFGEWFDGALLGLRGRVYLPRCVSAFVGADTTCALLASKPVHGENMLLVDLGTNGELAFCHDDEIVCASTAAGPALEGADISSGMRAGAGAIDSVRYDPDRCELKVHVIGEGSARGICGSGLISAVAALLDAGILDESGYLEAPYELAPGVLLTPGDIRSLQLAKSAIRTGIELICGGVRPDRLCIAGNFGRGLDLGACRRIGLLPDCGRVEILGNAALTGAEMILDGADERFETRSLSLAEDERFSELFCENMLF